MTKLQPEGAGRTITELRTMQAQPLTPLPSLTQNRWAELKRHLQRLATGARRLVYVPNEGNAGDALIAAGTWQFFEDCGLRPHAISRARLRAGDVAIYAGGGNLIPEYRRCAEFIDTCLARNVSAAVVLPHSIRGHQALLSRLDQRFTLVCRDATSLSYARSVSPKAIVLNAPDMALCLDVERLFARCRTVTVRSGLWWDLVWQLRVTDYLRWRKHVERLSAETLRPVMQVLRADAEAPAGSRDDPALDVPSFYGSKFRTRDEADVVARDLIGLMRQARKVVTNRLHVGVAAALSDVQVIYRDNSYGKIRAVYEASMTHMTNVSFSEDLAKGR